MQIHDGVISLKLWHLVKERSWLSVSTFGNTVLPHWAGESPEACCLISFILK